MANVCVCQEAPSGTGFEPGAVGCLKPGISEGQAREELSLIVRRLHDEHRDNAFASDAEALVKIHEGIAWPQPLPEIFAGDDLANSLDESDQQLKWLVLNADFIPLSEQPASRRF